MRQSIETCGGDDGSLCNVHPEELSGGSGLRPSPWIGIGPTPRVPLPVELHHYFAPTRCNSRPTPQWPPQSLQQPRDEGVNWRVAAEERRVFRIIPFLTLSRSVALVPASSHLYEHTAGIKYFYLCIMQSIYDKKNCTSHLLYQHARSSKKMLTFFPVHS